MPPVPPVPVVAAPDAAIPPMPSPDASAAAVAPAAASDSAPPAEESEPSPDVSRKPFGLYEALGAQQARFDALRASDPAAASAMFRLGQAMLSLASAGDVDGLDELVTATPQEYILHWFTCKMFQAACAQGRLVVVRVHVVVVVVVGPPQSAPPPPLPPRTGRKRHGTCSSASP